MDLGKGMPAGSSHYRAYVGPPERYGAVAALQFNLLTLLGLNEEHFLLDIGCGSCRAGRLFLPYLLPGRYFGIEPNLWLVREGLDREVGRDILAVKRPTFDDNDRFDLSVFNQEFDFLLAQSIFSHACPDQVRRCLQQARQVMRPEGMMLATYMLGPEDHHGDAWVYPMCVRYTAPFMEAAANAAGLSCLHIDWPHPRQQWILIIRQGLRPKLPAFVHVQRTRRPRLGAFFERLYARLSKAG